MAFLVQQLLPTAIFLSYTLRSRSAKENDNLVYHSYNLEAKELNSRSLSEHQVDRLLQFAVDDNDRVFGKKYWKQSQQVSNKKSNEIFLKSLRSTLDKFLNDKCLIVINNFLNVDIAPLDHSPLLLRKFEFALLHRKNAEDMYDFSGTDMIWVPKTAFYQINGNFSILFDEAQDIATFVHHCEISKHFVSFYIFLPNNAHCVELNLYSFAPASKPWQCQIQLDLFMSENLFEIRRNTFIASVYPADTYNMVTSLQPNIRLLLNLKTKFQENDVNPLLLWISNSANMPYSLRNDIYMIAQVTCNRFSIKLVKTKSCYIYKLSMIFPCIDCRHLLLVKLVSLEFLSIRNIKVLEKLKFYLAIPGKLFTTRTLDIAGQIVFFANTEKAALVTPLRNIYKIRVQYPDSLKLLGFAYASLFAAAMGNISEEGFRCKNYNEAGDKLKRQGSLLELVENYRGFLNTQNRLEQLHFISCSSRGL